MPEDFCDSPELVSYSFNYEEEGSLRNWVEKYNLTCESGRKIAMIGSSYFFGWLCALLVIPRLGDVIGRKLVFRVGLAFLLVGYTIVMTATSINVLIATMFVIGVCAVARVNCGFIYTMEFVP